MTKFLHLTEISSAKVVINAAAIASVRPSADGGATIYMTAGRGEKINVTDRFETVVRLLGAESA